MHLFTWYDCVLKLVWVLKSYSSLCTANMIAMLNSWFSYQVKFPERQGKQSTAQYYLCVELMISVANFISSLLRLPEQVCCYGSRPKAQQLLSWYCRPSARFSVGFQTNWLGSSPIWGQSELIATILTDGVYDTFQLRAGSGSNGKFLEFVTHLESLKQGSSWNYEVELTLFTLYGGLRILLLHSFSNSIVCLKAGIMPYFGRSDGGGKARWLQLDFSVWTC